MISSLACCSVMSAPRKIQACSNAEARNPASLSPRASTGKPVRRPKELFAVRFRLGDIGDEPDMGEPRGAQEPHDLHHAPVVDRLVAADEDALVVAVRRDGGKPRNEIVLRHGRVLKINPTVAADGDGKRLAILAERLRPRLR